MIMAMTLMVTACGSSDVDTEVNNSVESSVEVDDTNGGTTDTGKTDVVATPEPTVDPDSIPTEEREVSEFDTYYQFKTFSDNNVSVNTNMTVSSVLNAKLIGSVSIYTNKGRYIGYTKENIDVCIYGLDDGWCQLDTRDGSFFAKNEDVKAAMEDGSILDEYYGITSTEDNENNTDTKTEENLPSYTVEEMEETIMYLTVNGYEVRKGPGTEYERECYGAMNTRYAVTAKTSNGWYKVTDIVTTNEGFIEIDYLSVEPIILKEGETAPEVTKAPVEESTSSPKQIFRNCIVCGCCCTIPLGRILKNVNVVFVFIYSVFIQ